MPHLGNRELVRVFAKHEPYTDGHLGKVVAEMREKGAPIINVVEWRGDYYAVEGSHRLAAAYHLGLMPALIVSVPDHVEQSDEEFWERIKTTLPHYAWLRPPVEVRKIGPLQAMAAARIIDVSWLEHYRHFIPLRALRFHPGRKRLKETKRLILKPGTRAFLAFEGGRPVAAMIVTHRPRYAEVEELFVLPDYRARGIGTSLLNTAFQLARERRVRLRLGAMRANVMARRFYECHGGKLICFSRWGWGLGTFPSVDYEWPRGFRR